MMSFTLIQHHQGQNRFLFVGTVSENRMTSSRVEDGIGLLIVAGLCPGVLCIMLQFFLGNRQKMKTNFHKTPLFWR